MSSNLPFLCVATTTIIASVATAPPSPCHCHCHCYNHLSFLPPSTIFINIDATIHHCLNCYYTTIPLTLLLLLSQHHLRHCHNHFCHHLCHHIHEHHMSKKTKHKKTSHFWKNVFQMKIFSPKQTEY